VRKGLIDTHCHIFTEEFRSDITDVVQRAHEAGVSHVVMPGIDPGSIKDMYNVTDRFPGFASMAIGLHPTELHDGWKEDLHQIRSVLDMDMRGPHRFVAVGETGLDLYWDQSLLSEQIESFKEQIGWALEYDLPLIIHSRSADAQLLEVLGDYDRTALKGVFHCFSGDVEQVESLLHYENFMFGIGGVLTYRNSGLDRILPHIPIERVLTETDSPWLPPVPYRGKRNEPSYIIKVAEKMAQVYGTDIQTVIDVTSGNAIRLFSLETIQQDLG